MPTSRRRHSVHKSTLGRKLRQNRESLIALVSLLVAVIAAAVSVWGAIVSVKQYELAIQLASEQRFVSLAFEVSEDCKARISPLPDQAHLQELAILYGEYENPLDSTQLQDHVISLHGRSEIDLSVVVRLAYSGDPSTHVIMTSEQRESTVRENCVDGPEPYCWFYPSYVMRYPVLAHYRIELRGSIQDYWTAYELGVLGDALSEQDGRTALACTGLNNMGGFNNESDARAALRGVWQDLALRRNPHPSRGQ